jgi:pilus assembly protein CpaE
MTLIVEASPSNAGTYSSAVGGGEVVPTIESLKKKLDERPNEFAVVLGPTVNLEAAARLAESLRVSHPRLSVILLRPRVDTRVLTEALRSGMREVLEERDLTGLGQGVRRAHALWQSLSGASGSDDASQNGKLITVFSAKGGVGKTTVSTNLAVLLADGGHKSVCLVDLDLAFGDVAVTLQIMPTHTIADAVSMGSNLDSAGLESLLTKYQDGVVSLVAPIQPDAKDSISAELVARIIVLLKRTFDYVVVDTAPAFDDHVLVSFDHSDLLLLLLTLDIPAVKATKVTVETLDLLNYPREKIRLVLNRADSKVGLSVEEVEKALNFKVSATIPSSREVAASVNRGEPMPLAYPRHPVTDCLRSLANLATEALAPQPPAEPPGVTERAGRHRPLLFARGGRSS